MKSAEQRAHEIQKLIDSYQKQIKDIDSELVENKAETVDKKKYEILQEKDKEYTDFIKNFDSIQTHEQEQVNQLEKRIAEMLESMSRNLRMVSKPTTRQEAEEAIDIERYKTGVMKNDLETYEIAKREVEERKSQLIKMEHAEEGIEKQSNQYREKMSKMKEEMETKFVNIGLLVTKANNEKKRLSFLKEYYGNHKDSLREQVTYAAMKVDAKKMMLQENETYKNLTEQERKVAEFEASVFSTKSFIEGKKNETNYAKSLEDCMNIVNGINDEIIKAGKY
jgi:hypothetical protein